MIPGLHKLAPPCALGVVWNVNPRDEYRRIVAARTRLIVTNVERDYVRTTIRVCDVVLARSVLGVLVGRSGLGCSIVANKIRGIRAARCLSVEDVKTARFDISANVLCLSEAAGLHRNSELIAAFLQS